MTDHRKRALRKVIGPPRKVIGRHRNEYGAWIETLECGHEKHERKDHYGPTNAAKRRCRKCQND